MAPTEISLRNTNEDTAQELKLVIGVIVSTLISAALLAIVIILLVRNRKKNAQLRDLQAQLKVELAIKDYHDRVLWIYEKSHGELPEDVRRNAAGAALHHLPQHLQIQPWTVPELPAAPRPTAQTPHARSNNDVQRQGASVSRVVERIDQLRQKIARSIEPCPPVNDGIRQRDEEEMFSIGRDSDDSDRETVRPVPAASVRGESSSRAETSRSSPGRGASPPRQQAPASASGEGSSSRRQARFAEGS